MRFLMLMIVTAALGLVTRLPAQVDTLWTRSIGEDGWDFGESVQQTTDGGYIIAGVTGADVYHQSDVYLVKTDEEGHTQWTKAIGRSHTGGRDYGSSVQQTEDEGYIITGFTYLVDEDALLEVYLVKTDDSGDTVWTRTFGGSMNDAGESVQQTDDGGFIITGYTYSCGAGDADAFLIKTDESGNAIWMRAFGGPSTDVGYEVQQTSDGGYVMVGSTSSFGAGQNDVYLVKTDEQGCIQWTSTYGGADDEQGFSVQQTSSGGYILAGVTKSYGTGDFDVYLVRTDESGDILWTRTLGGPGRDSGFSVRETVGGGYIAAGRTNSFGEGDDDVYLIKTDMSGNVTWSWVFEGTRDEAARAIRQTTDGGYIVAGNTSSYYSGNWDVYLMRIDVDPIPVVRANGSDGPIVVTKDDPVRVTASLDPGNRLGISADWWVGALTTSGTYWIDPSLQWVKSSVPVSVGQYPLFYHPEVPLINMTLPVGFYTFFLALDQVPDGVFDVTWYDCVNVISTSGEARIR